MQSMEFDGGHKKRGCCGCLQTCPGKVCCCVLIFLGVVILALGIAAAVIYRGVPAADLKRVDMKNTTTVTQTPPTLLMDMDLILEIDNPNRLTIKVKDAQGSMFYPQGSRNQVGKANLPDGATVESQAVSEIKIFATLRANSQENSKYAAPMVADCIQKGVLPVDVEVYDIELRIMDSYVTIGGPFLKKVDLPCQ